VPADQRAVLDADIVETDVRGPRTFLAHLGRPWGDFDSGRVGRNEEDGDAAPSSSRAGAAKTMNKSATGALVMNRFCPLMIQSALSRTAFVRSPMD